MLSHLVDDKGLQAFSLRHVFEDARWVMRMCSSLRGRCE